MKILLFLAKGFETIEASAFIDVMGWARNDYHYDIDVVTCGFQKNVISTFGVPVTVDKLLKEICIDDYDALAIPGGFEEYGFYEEAYSKELSEVINKFNSQHKFIATVCVAALALGYSGVLTGKKATTYHLNNGNRQKQLAEFGVEIVNKPVVITDNIITSYCPQTAPEVAFTLLEKLIGTKEMNIVKTAMGF
ncbi:MAG: DJ-1/PfpI family protein [Ruminococcus sp.]|uniref:DJ-1/PfpI family protein n=1 Tax=Ruminococcus sp. TaxID=41978 RepID=UPI001B275AAD|nr:DJ-1/PfpI family protein [Ruminococcus sp.]MBO7472843.1 DJ-1/PfpI family protein [Ruminococcus sp.]